MRNIKSMVFAVLLLIPAALLAQDDRKGEQEAEHVFQLLLNNRTDSLYDMFADAVKAQMPRQLLEDGMKKAEQLAGPYQGHGSWEHQQCEGMDIYTSVIDFEQGQLNLVIAFDEQLQIHGLRIMPLREDMSADDMPLPDDAVELQDTVRTGPDIALPCNVVISGRSASPPMVVFVHGSGPCDRNETVAANRPFLDLSRQLAERGISSLRYDKRTYAYSRDVSSMEEETIDDALSAIRLAQSYAGRVYLLGHSLGGMLAPVIASRTKLDGIVMMAAPARDLPELLDEQLDYLLPPDALEEQKQAAIAQMQKQSPHYLRPQHQVEAAQRLSIPVLIMQGGRDYQVSMEDFNLWRQALADKPQVVFASYAALNHLFLEGEGKSTPQEYSKKGIIPAQVADDIATFIAGSAE